MRKNIMKPFSHDEILSLDNPGRIIFYGCEEADIFTGQIADSLQGILDNNYFYDPDNIGFIQASNGDKPWNRTMWTRDAGTMLRELVYYGYAGRASLTAMRLIDLVKRNEAGYFAFPQHFYLGESGSGDEIDGTCSIIIGMLLLRKRLMCGNINDTADHVAGLLSEFLLCDGSPVFYIIDNADTGALVAGTGEFGGGCGIEGAWCNVVQNFLISLTCSMVGRELREANPGLADKAEKTAARLNENMKRYLTDEKGFIWCVDPEDFKSVGEIIHHPINEGFTGLNGIGAMYADVFGYDPAGDGFWGTKHVVDTFNDLLSRPARKEQYEKYGFYSQFDLWRNALNSSPSYGFGYAIQLATIFELPQRDRILSCLISQTRNPDPAYRLTRSNRNWFYERYHSPDLWKYLKNPDREWIGEDDKDTEGCGALNLVNVAEPLKIARLIAGADDTGYTLRMMPRLPSGYKGVRFVNWPVVNRGELTHIDLDYKI